MEKSATRELDIEKMIIKAPFTSGVMVTVNGKLCTRMYTKEEREAMKKRSPRKLSDEEMDRLMDETMKEMFPEFHRELYPKQYLT